MNLSRTFVLVLASLFILSACAPAPTPPIVTTLPPTALPVVTAAAPVATSVSPTNVPAATAAPTRRVVNFEQLKQNVDTAVSSFMKENNIVGCSAAVEFPDAANKLETHILNYGVLSKGSKTQVDSTTEYEIGSLTKLFTADVLALLVREGQMQLDDPLQKYLPPSVHAPTFNGQAITLRDLATHTSGLPRNLGTGLGARTVNGAVLVGYDSQEEIFNFLNAFKLTRAPGSQSEYSNYAFSLLGIAEERAFNASYESLVVQKVAEPLGLRDTRVTLSPVEKAKLGQGYFENSGDAAPPFADSGGTLAMGALRSTIQDLATHLAANIDPGSTKFGPALQMTQEPQTKLSSQTQTMGLGWSIIYSSTPREILQKDGATAGFNGDIVFSKVNRTGFVAICNGHGVAEHLVPAISKALGLAESQFDENK